MNLTKTEIIDILKDKMYVHNEDAFNRLCAGMFTSSKQKILFRYLCEAKFCSVEFLKKQKVYSEKRLFQNWIDSGVTYGLISWDQVNVWVNPDIVSNNSLWVNNW